MSVRAIHADEADTRPWIQTRLAAIFPFAKKEYKKDFQNDAIKRERTPEEWWIAPIRQDARSPAIESVFQIDDEAMLGTPNPKDRNLAYPNLGDVLLEHTDVLVAVSDDVNRGAGGTVDVIRSRGVKHSGYQDSTKEPEVYLMHAAGLDELDQSPRKGEQVAPPGCQKSIPKRSAG